MAGHLNEKGPSPKDSGLVFGFSISGLEGQLVSPASVSALIVQTVSTRNGLEVAVDLFPVRHDSSTEFGSA